VVVRRVALLVAAARIVDIDGKVIDEFEMLPRAALSTR
jgi:hypothetical protein